jgi:hypothetical protein
LRVSFAHNVIAALLAILGFVTPLTAAPDMSGSSMPVTRNAGGALLIGAARRSPAGKWIGNGAARP